MNHFCSVLSKRGAIDKLVPRMTLLLVLDGANAEEHSIIAAMKTADSIVLIMVYLCFDGNNGNA